MVILPFTSPEVTLETAGGKGANLARLTRAGFPVPRGFIISTDAYRAFVEANRWLPTIESAVESLSAENASALEKSSAQIRAAFSLGVIPTEVETAIRTAYAEFNDAPVAVRSSATAEDLPDLSFAGQQDTYLNIIGIDELLKAIINCWSSLWTARAIGYRMRNHISHRDVALAVVVQEMIPSEVSGVMFTANPLTGSLREVVIDATFGLGEALVSGQVEPDHYVVDTVSNAIVSKKLGAKEISTRGLTGGGVKTMQEDASNRQALTDDEILQVATLGMQVQKEYDFPQDIEWAFADGKPYLLQSRAITSLYPLPETSHDPLKIWFSFDAIQGVLGPYTPLGQDEIRMLISGAARIFGANTHFTKIDVMLPAGERLWMRISDVMRHPLGSKIAKNILPILEPSVGKIIFQLSAEPKLGAGRGKLKFSTIRRLAHFGLPVIGRVIRTMHKPEKARAEFDSLIEQELSKMNISATRDMLNRLAQRIEFMETRSSAAFPVLLPRFIPMLAPSIILLNALTELAAQTSEGEHGFSPLALEVTRGIPNNVTTQMDLSLWDTARMLQADKSSLDMFNASDARTLARHYLNGTLPPAAQNAITRFMDQYGMRGTAEIDMGQPRWREDPTPVMQSLQSYLKITDENFAPDVLFARGAKTAEQAIEKLAAAARRQRNGWFKERMVRFAARRIRILMGAREAPKFFIIRMMGIIRNELLASGADLEQAGILNKADDIFFLHVDELKSLANNEPRDWKALVAVRRSVYEREARRRQIPLVLVSDGRAFYEGVGAEEEGSTVIAGSPVSPGVAEGIVHIIFNPHESQLAPGEILVCPATDPAWTPLFMSAGGLITEIGGMMTHGSVVAREYGIPAVVGVHQATMRLKTGQRIRIDGTAGKIVIIEQ